MGWSVGGKAKTSLNDVNGDGIPDFIVGIPDMDATGLGYTDCGAAQLFYGGSPITVGTTVTGLSNSTHAGTSVSVGVLLYRTVGIGTGATSGSNSSDQGGAVQIWRWQ